MQRKNIQVNAVPTAEGSQQFLLECSECGPMHMVMQPDMKEECLQHLESHGVNTDPWRVESTQLEGEDE